MERDACCSSGVLLDTAARSFVNPIADGADPWVFEKDGHYFFCGSTVYGIYISKSNKLNNPGNRITVWQAPKIGWNKCNIWAPELHFMDGRWYIYYAAGEKPGRPFISQRSGVLVSSSEDPFSSYEDLGMLYTGDSMENLSSVKWAIDLTPFKWQGKRYAIWSGWEENKNTDRTPQHLYIATMSSPSSISSNRVRISSPEKLWETGGKLDLNEGPQILINNDKVFIIYSTRESWLKKYRLGQLALIGPNADPMVPENWVKSGPVFQGNDQVYGVGHCSFTKSPDGKENWLLYHSKKTTYSGWARDIRLQPFAWKADGSPDFGTPVPAGQPIPLPSGEDRLCPSSV